MRLAAHGDTNEEIGQKLGLTTETIKSHRRHIISRLGAKNIRHACVMVAMNAPELLR